MVFFVHNKYVLLKQKFAYYNMCSKMGYINVLIFIAREMILNSVYYYLMNIEMNIINSIIVFVFVLF